MTHAAPFPDTRAARIELARSTIADRLGDGDQLDVEPITSLDVPSIVMFTVQVPHEQRASELIESLPKAMCNAGFDAIAFGSLRPVDGAYRIAVYVPVGAP